jgi:hypothetical protein
LPERRLPDIGGGGFDRIDKPPKLILRRAGASCLLVEGTPDWTASMITSGLMQRRDSRSGQGRRADTAAGQPDAAHSPPIFNTAVAIALVQRMCVLL